MYCVDPAPAKVPTATNLSCCGMAVPALSLAAAVHGVRGGLSFRTSIGIRESVDVCETPEDRDMASSREALNEEEDIPLLVDNLYPLSAAIIGPSNLCASVTSCDCPPLFDDVSLPLFLVSDLVSEEVCLAIGSMACSGGMTAIFAASFFSAQPLVK